MRQMQNRKSADGVITVGWNAGTATRCAVSIGNFPAKHSSAATAGWNTSQTTELATAAIGAIHSPRRQPGQIPELVPCFLVSAPWEGARPRAPRKRSLAPNLFSPLDSQNVCPSRTADREDAIPPELGRLPLTANLKLYSSSS